MIKHYHHDSAKAIAKHYFKELALALVLALTLALLIELVAYLFNAGWEFRNVFWPTLIILESLTLAINIIEDAAMASWRKQYLYELKQGRSQRSAIEEASKKVKVHLPKWLFKILTAYD